MVITTRARIIYLLGIQLNENYQIVRQVVYFRNQNEQPARRGVRPVVDGLEEVAERLLYGEVTQSLSNKYAFTSRFNMSTSTTPTLPIH